MSEDTEPMFRVPDARPGERTYVSPITRFVYREMPQGWEQAQACVLKDGTQVVAVQRGLTRAQRRDAVKMALARLRAPRRAVLVLYGADMLRRAAQPAQRSVHFIQQIPGAVNIPAPGIITVAATVGIIGGIGGATYAGFHAHDAPAGPAAGSPAWHRNHPVHLKLPPQPLAYLGAYEPASPNSYAGMETFAQTCGRQPNLALYYLGWGGSFNRDFAMEAAQHGAIPVIQLNPEFPATVQTGIQHKEGPGPGIPEAVSLDAIADGEYDSYLTYFADQVSDYGRAVVISFAPEVNGNWYPWSAQPASDYIAAWRHIVTLFRKQGADNVTWMWTVNRIGSGIADPSGWWPGAGYVTWVGVDGYYRHPWQVWADVFAPTITEVKEVTSDPILISETAIGQAGTRPRQLADMYNNIRAGNYLGMLWFDEDKGRLHYRIEGDPGAIRVMRSETETWRLQHQERKH